MGALTSYLDSKIVFTILYVLLILYYTVKLMMMKDQKILAQHGMSKRISYVDFEDNFEHKNKELFELK